MTDKFTSRKAKDIATASSYAFSKKKIAGNSATSNIYTSVSYTHLRAHET